MPYEFRYIVDEANQFAFAHSKLSGRAESLDLKAHGPYALDRYSASIPGSGKCIRHLEQGSWLGLRS